MDQSETVRFMSLIKKVGSDNLGSHQLASNETSDQIAYITMCSCVLQCKTFFAANNILLMC